jgi:hypothetical protein
LALALSGAGVAAKGSNEPLYSVGFVTRSPRLHFLPPCPRSAWLHDRSP